MQNLEMEVRMNSISRRLERRDLLFAAEKARVHALDVGFIAASSPVGKFRVSAVALREVR